MSVFSCANEETLPSNMQLTLVLCAVIAAASAGYIGAPTTLVRTPAFDSAVIKSDRLGGNFAYSTSEGHAYSAITPVVQNVVSPVGVSYTAHSVPVAAPAIAYAAPAYAGAYAAPAYAGAYGALPYAGYGYGAGAYLG